MRTTLGLLVAAATVFGLTSAPAHADVLFVNSDGTTQTIAPDVMLDSDMYTTTTTTRVSPTVIEEPMTTQILTQPAVIERPVVLKEHARRAHFFRLGLPGLFGVHVL